MFLDSPSSQEKFDSTWTFKGPFNGQNQNLRAAGKILRRVFKKWSKYVV